MFDVYSRLYHAAGRFRPWPCWLCANRVSQSLSLPLPYIIHRSYMIQLSHELSCLRKYISRFRDEPSHQIIAEAAFSMSSHTKCLQLFSLLILAPTSPTKASPILQRLPRRPIPQLLQHRPLQPPTRQNRPVIRGTADAHGATASRLAAICPSSSSRIYTRRHARPEVVVPW